MGTSLDMDRIAKELGAERRGKVSPGGGYFGALQLAAEVAARFRVPEGGGQATDPSWSEQRSVRLSPKTLEQLEKLAERRTPVQCKLRRCCSNELCRPLSSKSKSV